MTEKEFFRRVTNSKKDFLGEFLTKLRKKKIPFCVIGGLAINAYAEPVVTLDADFVIAADKLKEILPEIKKCWKVKEFEHSINIYSRESDLRIQIQTESSLQKCIQKARIKNILGYRIPVASIDDLFTAKIVAASASERRESKRLKDYADILRLIEVKKDLARKLPPEIKKKLREKL